MVIWFSGTVVQWCKGLMIRDALQCVFTVQWYDGRIAVRCSDSARYIT